MLPPVPCPSDYDISEENGFLPANAPLDYLADPYYAKWEAIVANLQALLLSKRLRQVVRELPTITASRLRKTREWRRAYVLLSFIVHAYIWGGDRPEERIPPSVSIPFKQVCRHLELPTVATYSAFCLWNWKKIFEDEAVDSLSNLSTLSTFTGSLDESWFYLVSVAIEARGGPTIPLMLGAITAVRRGDRHAVIDRLRHLAEVLDELCVLLEQMYENCDPHVFYHRIRPFLAGSNNMAEAGLPNGILFDTGSGMDRYCKFGGGSNAQSSLIQFFDIVLGIEHRPTGEKKGEGKSKESALAPSRDSELLTEATAPPPRHNFIHEMRSYMPGPHQRFLSDVTAVSNIKEYVNVNRNDKNLTIAYDACLAMLRNLRSKHMQMVTRYVILKSHESRSRNTVAGSLSPRAAPNNEPPIDGGDKGRLVPDAKGIKTKIIVTSCNTPDVKVGAKQTQKPLRGTGGTALIPFLKQARDETGEPAIDDWFQRQKNGGPIMAKGSGNDSTSRASLLPIGKSRSSASLSKLNEHADGGIEIVGLSGVWTMDEMYEGGICHW